MKSRLQNITKNIFNRAKTCKTDFQYVDLYSLTYDPANTDLSKNESVYDTSGFIIRDEQVDGTDRVDNTILKVLINKEDLPIVPKNERNLIIDNTQYTVIDVNIDFAKSTWILQVRRP